MAALRPQTRARHLQLKIQKLRQQLAEAEAALPLLGVEAPPPAPLFPAETFATVFQASPTLMALSELETGRYVDVNEAFLRTLGFEREAVVGHTAQELGLFARPEQRQAALERLQAEGRLRNFEVSVRARSGELRTGRFAAEFVHVGDRRLLLTVMEDVTDQQRTEAALLASEARFRSYVEFAPHAIFVVDRQGRYVDFNPAALDLLGYPPAELARLSIADVIDEADLERGLQSFGVVMSAGQAEGEFRLRHRAGHAVWVALRAVRLNDERFIAFCQDVTAQHAAEQAAQASEVRYRTTLDAMLEGCQIIGFDWRYLYLNEAAIRQARQTRAALLGRTMPEVYPGIETTELFAVLQRCMADRQPRRIDNEFTYPDGQVGRFELSIQPVAEGLFILSQDVSARRQAEAALRQSEERYRLLTENMADVVWVLDTATLHFSYVSPSVERLRGYTVAEVLAQTIDQVMTPASLAMIQAELPGRLAAFLAGDSAAATQTHEVEQIRRDGSLVWTEVVTTLLRQPGGGVEVLGVSRDIGERRRAADALRESEARYRALFEGAAIGIFHSTFEGQYLDLNPALARMLGYATPAEVLADIHDVARQTYTDPARRETIIAQLLDQGGTLVVENRYHRRGGPDWDAYLHLRCVTDPAGRPLYLEGFIEDITERKRAETALRESERKLQTLVELLPIGISILDAERRVVYANPALGRILDLDREQFFQGPYRGRRYLNADRTPLPADGFASLRALREGRPVLDVETGMVTEAGREIWTSVSAAPVDFADWRVVIATTDITERKRAEEALRESEARYRGLIDSAPDAIFVNRADQVAFVNAACLRLFGAERPEQLLGRSPFELIHPDDHAAVRERIRQMRATGQAVPPREQRMLRLDGSAVAVEASAAPFRDQGVDAIHVTLRDITERQRAEAALRESEERFTTLFSKTATPTILLLAPERIIVEVNEAMERLTGFTRAEMLGKTPVELGLLRPETADASLRRFLRHGELVGQLAQLHTRSGEVRTVLANALSVVIAGRPHALTTMLDLTTQLEAEEQLRQSQANFRHAFDANPVALAIARRATGELLLINAAHTRAFGYTLEEILAQRKLDQDFYAHPDDRAAWLQELQDAGAVREREVTVRLKSGETRPMLLSLQPVEFDGQTCILSALVDLTERKRAEAERVRLLERLDLAARAAGMGIWDWDIVRNVLAWDDQMYSLYGLKPGEFGGAYAAWLQGVHQEDRDLSNTHSAQAVRGEQEYDSEFRVQWPDGTVRWLKAAGQVFRDAQGAPVRMVGVNYDITERKRAEDELRRSNAELEQFAYVASHDLQEPLRGVAGMVQLLQHNYQGRLDAGADELIGHAVEAAGRMQALINDLLAYSRAGRRGGTFQRLEAHTALQAALDNLAVTVAETEAVITPGPLPAVVADPTQLTQVFQNLLSNALKFRGGRRPVITVTAERQAGAWRFAVQDNGLGIEPQYFERIFLIFQRLHTRREYPGTGIGLALCQRIIERHGGRLWVESQPGQGSTFYFTLPDREPSDDR